MPKFVGSSLCVMEGERENNSYSTFDSNVRQSSLQSKFEDALISGDRGQARGNWSLNYPLTNWSTPI